MEVWNRCKSWVLFLRCPSKGGIVRLALDEFAGYLVLLDSCMLLSNGFWICVILLEATLVCVWWIHEASGFSRLTIGHWYIVFGFTDFLLLFFDASLLQPSSSVLPLLLSIIYDNRALCEWSYDIRWLLSFILQALWWFELDHRNFLVHLFFFNLFENFLLNYLDFLTFFFWWLRLLVDDIKFRKLNLWLDLDWHGWRLDREQLDQSLRAEGNIP